MIKSLKDKDRFQAPNLPKSIACTPGRDTPAPPVIRVAPQEIAHWTFVGHLLQTVKGPEKYIKCIFVLTPNNGLTDDSYFYTDFGFLKNSRRFGLLTIIQQMCIRAQMQAIFNTIRCFTLKIIVLNSCFYFSPYTL